MRKAIFRERLGDIATTQLNSVTNPSRTAPINFQLIRSQFPHGFVVMAEFEMTVFDTDAEKKAFMVGPAATPEKKLMRLILEPLNE